MKLDKELVAASSVLIILSILSKGDSYGYAIIQRVRQLSAGNIEWTDGMLYPVLHWLNENGHIRGRWLKSETGRKRCYYSLQTKGKKTLDEQKRQWGIVTSTFKELWRDPECNSKLSSPTNPGPKRSGERARVYKPRGLALNMPPQ
jgi:PadR family transcriptional regulator PadR